MPKISELPAASALDGTESVPLVQGGVSKKATGLVAAKAALDALDAAAMKLGVAQTVTGAKTFNAGTLLDKGSEVHNVQAYGAVVGGTAATNKAAFLAAINAAKAATRVGVVFVPSGEYDVGDLIITLPQSENKTLVLQGAGRHASRLYFSIDRGADTFAIAGEATGQTCFNVIRDLTIAGPGVVVPLTFGTLPANMHGIKLQAGLHVERVSVAGFKGGLVASTDHVGAKDCRVRGNFYGLYFAYMTTTDDHVFVDCDFTSNFKASIAIAGGTTNFMAGATFLRGHLGYCPYGIFIETGVAATKIASSQFLGTAWEALGNAAIFSEGQTGNASDLVLQDCRPFSINNSLYGLPASTAPDMFYLNRISGWRILGGGFSGFGFTPTNAYINCVFNDLPLIWETSWYNTLEVANSAGVALIICAGNNGGVSLRSGGGGGTESKIHYAFGNHGGVGVVQKGDLLSRANGGAVQRCTAISLPVGVAMNTPTKTSELTIVAKHAEYVYVNTVETSVLFSDILVTDTTTPYKVAKLTLATAVATRPIVGNPRDTVASVTGGKFLAHVSF